MWPSPKQKWFGRWNAKLNMGESFPLSLEVKRKEFLCTNNPLFLLYFSNSSSSVNENGIKPGAFWGENRGQK